MHEVTRVRREVKRRTATVSSVEQLTPAMLRIVFKSEEFDDFESASPDDHVKMSFPNPDNPDLEPAKRDFTPRSFDKTSLTIDFALHDAGPAIDWAKNAEVGDSMTIGGPRGSSVVPDDFDWYLFVGDETALPAIGRWVEQLRANVPVSTYAVIEGANDKQTFKTAAAHKDVWVVRSPGSDDAAALLKELANFEAPKGDGYIWIAAEASVAKTLRDYFLNRRQHPKAWVKAAGYWKRGVADADMKIED
jgi:NADPH-dependent ferric siderophore reductase